MAGKRQRSNGTWEFKFTRKGVLLSPVYFTFDTEAEGDAYAARVEPLLERGVVPTEMTGTTLRTMGDLLDLYAGLTTLAPSEVEQLKAVRNALGSTKMELLTYSWAEAWVERMKAGGKAPSTLKKYVGVLARAVDWAMRTEKVTLMTNPLRLLPRGYGTKGVDKEKLWAGERDRRLEPSEEGAIRKTLIKKEEGLLFDMALETAMRMREMFTLTVGQIDLEQRTIFLDKTKNGSKRQVPISSVLLALLSEAVAGKEKSELLFAYWDGVEDMKTCSNRLSHLYKTRFSKAKVYDFHFHDCRHEATSRLYERTTMSDLEISKITGHKDLRMLARYANLRGSDLASKMW